MTHLLRTAAKGQFIHEAGLLGFAMWEAAGDFEDILLDAISEGLGIGEECSSSVVGSLLGRSSPL